MTAATAALLSDPIINHYTEASGDRAQFGWPLDEEIEKLRMEYVREGDPKKQFELAEKVQKRVLDLGVTVPLGQFVQPMARRRSVSGVTSTPRFLIVSGPTSRARRAARSAFSRYGSASRTAKLRASGVDAGRSLLR